MDTAPGQNRPSGPSSVKWGFNASNSCQRISDYMTFDVSVIPRNNEPSGASAKPPSTVALKMVYRSKPRPHGLFLATHSIFRSERANIYSEIRRNRRASFYPRTRFAPLMPSVSLNWLTASRSASRRMMSSVSDARGDSSRQALSRLSPLQATLNCRWRTPSQSGCYPTS